MFISFIIFSPKMCCFCSSKPLRVKDDALSGSYQSHRMPTPKVPPRSGKPGDDSTIAHPEGK